MPKRYYLTLIWTWPIDLILWFYTAVIFRPLFGRNLHFEGLVLQCERRNKPYLFKFGDDTINGINLGHVALYRHGGARKKGLDTRIERHEHVHTEQYEANCLYGFILAVFIFASTKFWYVGLVVWLLTHYLLYYCAGFQGIMRGEDGYRGNTHEESAYAQENQNEK